MYVCMYETYPVHACSRLHQYTLPCQCFSKCHDYALIWLLARSLSPSLYRWKWSCMLPDVVLGVGLITGLCVYTHGELLNAHLIELCASTEVVNR